MTDLVIGQKVQVYRRAADGGHDAPIEGVVEAVYGASGVVDVNLPDQGIGLGSIAFCTGGDAPEGSYCTPLGVVGLSADSQAEEPDNEPETDELEADAADLL